MRMKNDDRWEVFFFNRSYFFFRKISLHFERKLCIHVLEEFLFLVVVTYDQVAQSFSFRREQFSVEIYLVFLLGPDQAKLALSFPFCSAILCRQRFSKAWQSRTSIRDARISL